MVSERSLTAADPAGAILDRDAAELCDAPIDWSRLDGATVVLTGATGLIGGYAAEVLLRRARLAGTRPPRLVLLVRSPEKAHRRFAHHGERVLRVVEHHLDRPLDLEGGADFVIHAGAPALPTEFVRDPVAAYVPNVLGTHHLLEWAAGRGVEKLLFVSTGAVHGPLPVSEGPFGEHRFGPLDPLDRYSCYAESKRMGEAACAAWSNAGKVATTVARLGHSYGPGISRSDTRSFAEFVFAALDGRDIVLRSAGAARRPFCYLSDATAGLLTALLEGMSGEAYLVANTDAVLSIRELAELVAKLAPGGATRVRFDGSTLAALHPPGPDDVATPDTARLRALGWAPRVAPEEGFRRTLRAHQRKPLAAGVVATP